MTIKTYTNDEIANACNNYVSDWDIETLVSFAYDEMYRYYTKCATADSLDEFMQENDDA